MSKADMVVLSTLMVAFCVDIRVLPGLTLMVAEAVALAVGYNSQPCRPG
ncbi:MAG: hypothetical protein ABIJ86_14090 [Spirochaetota bacterium]